MSTLRPALRPVNSVSSLNSVSSTNPTNSYKPPMANSYNVMEFLVVEEVNKQIKLLPIKTARYIKSPDVVAYALNRLPSLYATSKRGWQRHLHHAKTELKEKISVAVQQGIIAVQRDPLRVSDLLYSKEDNMAVYEVANAALDKLKVVLKRDDLSWDNLSSVVEESLHSTTSVSRSSINPRNHGRLAHSTDHWETYRY